MKLHETPWTSMNLHESLNLSEFPRISQNLKDVLGFDKLIQHYCAILV